MIKLKNKKADVSSTILVVGVIGLCAMAILSFFFSALSVRDSFFGLKEMEQMNADIDRTQIDIVQQRMFVEEVPEILSGLSPFEGRTNQYLYREFMKDEKVLFWVKYYLP